MEKESSISHEKRNEEFCGPVHHIVDERRVESTGISGLMSAYSSGDLVFLQNSSPPAGTYLHNLSAIDELLERDKQREKDGFPRKIHVGKLVKPGRGGK